MKRKMAEENLKSLRELRVLLNDAQNGRSKLGEIALVRKLEELLKTLNKNTPPGFDSFSVSSDFLYDFVEKGRDFKSYKEERLLGWKHLSEAALMGFEDHNGLSNSKNS